MYLASCKTGLLRDYCSADEIRCYCINVRECHLSRNSEYFVKSLSRQNCTWSISTAAQSYNTYQFIQPPFPKLYRNTAWAHGGHIWRAVASSSWTHSPGMCQLHDTRCTISLRYCRPPLPFANMRFLERLCMADHVPFD